MRDIPEELKVLKNQLNQENPWLILLDITLNDDDSTVIRLVRNTEDVLIPADSDNPSVDILTYTAFNFEMDINKLTNAGEIPTLKIKVSNVERFLQSYLEDLDGLVGATCTITVINASELNLDYSEMEQTWDIVETSSNEMFVEFTLSLPNLLRIRYPLNKFLSSHCNHKYRERECNYVGALETCERNFKDCQAHDNTARFGGFLGLSDSTVRIV